MSTEIKGDGYNYRVEWFADCNTKQPMGRISYVFRDGSSSPMSTQTRFECRRSWHHICRIQRAKRNGREYLHIINRGSSELIRRLKQWRKRHEEVCGVLATNAVLAEKIHLEPS